MTVHELQDLHTINAGILSSPCAFISSTRRESYLILFRGASTSTYVQRVLAEQATVESRLIELDGVETINIGLKNTQIRGENDMVVDPPPEPPINRTLEAKKKVLAQFVRQSLIFQCRSRVEVDSRDKVLH